MVFITNGFNILRICFLNYKELNIKWYSHDLQKGTRPSILCINRLKMAKIQQLRLQLEENGP